MFKMKKVTILIASLLAAMLVIAACGNGGGAGGGVDADAPVEGHIVVGGWPAADEAFEAIIPMFNEQFPDVEVELLMSPAGDFRQLLITSFAAGSGAPDVVMLEGGWMGELRESPALENLYDEPYDGGRFADAFVEFRWEFAHSLDGRLTAIPWDIGPATFFYRADIFEEVGLPTDPDEVHALISTWDGFLSVAEAVHIPGERWLVANAPYLFQWVFMNRDFFNERLELQLDRPGAIEALEAAITMRENGWDAQIGMWQTEANAGLASGAIVSSLAGCWYGGFLKSWISPDNVGNWRVSRLPGGLPDSNWGGSFVGIPSQSENKLAAWAFIEFSMTTPEAQNAMFEAVDYFPALISAWDDDEVYNWEDPYFGGQRTRALWVEIAGNIRPIHSTMIDGAAEGNLVGAVNTGLAEGMNAQEIMDYVYEFINSVIREEREVNIDMLRDAGLWDDSWD